jgi:hypothetical protein
MDTLYRFSSSIGLRAEVARNTEASEAVETFAAHKQ